MIGQTLSHYRILDRLGEGGMGEVFLAEDTSLHRPVALKLLRACDDCADETRERLLREARAASALNHPNIAAVYEVGDAAGADGPISFMAMEYVEGKTLSAFLDGDGGAGDGDGQGAARLDRLLALWPQIASGLQAAHERGVVHRDLKPSNLMVTAAGLVKLLDFGVALSRRTGGPDDSTWTAERWEARAEIIGTPFYMAPEQALGHPTDARADLFSLGVVLYEAISGRRPFDGDNVAQVLDAVVHRVAPPLRTRLAPALAADPRMATIERVLDRMLAKEPDRRYATMAEVVAELERIATRGGVVEAAAAPGLTVAVLGFRNITAGGEDDWLASALTETVTSALAAIDGLEVFGRDRVADALRRMAEEGEGEPAAGGTGGGRATLVGRRVGARWVVEGGFQRLGEQVRATAQIVEAESGKVLRAVQADGEMRAIFALQDRLVDELGTGLRTSVAAVEAGGGETTVVGAFEALQRGILNARVDTHESWERALLFFERAVALDPDYARAHLELGVAYGQKAENLIAPEFRDRALFALRRARDLKPRWARPWREIGITLVYMGRESEGLENLRHALKLAPEDPLVLAGLGRAHFLGRGDFAEAAKYLRRAVEKNPQAGWYWLQLAHVLALLRDFEGGDLAAQRAVELQEEFLSGQQGVLIVGAHMRRAHLAALRGEPDEALAHLQREVNFLQGVDHALRARILIELNLRLGAAHRALGHAANAEAAFLLALEAFERRVALGADDPYTRYYAAGAHALRGETDLALASLAKAVAARPAFTRARARIEPEFEGLRGERRFQELMGVSGA